MTGIKNGNIARLEVTQCRRGETTRAEKGVERTGGRQSKVAWRHVLERGCRGGWDEAERGR